MSAPDNFDRAIESWLTEGPHRLPDAAVNRIVGEIERIDARKPAWLPRRETMNRLVLSFGGVAVLLIVVIGAAYYFGPKPSVPGSGKPYSSSRHGYSLQIPTNWTVNEIAGSWAPGAVFPYLGPGSDQFVDPAHGDITRFMNSQPITGGMTSEQWLTQYIAIHTAFFDNCRQLSEAGVQAGGQPATMYTFDCSGAGSSREDSSQVLLTHDGRGYAFRVITDGPGDEKQILTDWIATLGWVPVTP